MCIAVDLPESEFTRFQKDRDFDIHTIMINHKFSLGLLPICCNLTTTNFTCTVFLQRL